MDLTTIIVLTCNYIGISSNSLGECGKTIPQMFLVNFLDI